MLIAVNKPFGMLSQFTDRNQRPTLADIVPVPGVYPVGRLDRDSEGLLLLTDDGALQHRLSDPRHGTAKHYLVQVEGTPTAAALDRLRRGPRLGDGPTRPAELRLLARRPGWLWSRDPPVRPRRGAATCWLEVVLREGRRRQLRRMTAAVGLPTLRLLRVRIGDYGLQGLLPGSWREVDPPA